MVNVIPFYMPLIKDKDYNYFFKIRFVVAGEGPVRTKN